MLQQMREWFRYLKWILILIIASFIWWAVAVWGGSGPASPGVEAPWAARVNGRAIAVGAFQSHARQLDAAYRSLLGEQYAQQRPFMRLGQQAINGLVEQELVHQEALRQGIRVSPREVAEAITRDPGLQEDGRFIGVERYRNLFRGGRLGLEEYESGVRRDLVTQKFRSLIEDAVMVTDAEVEEEFLQRNERTTVDYVIADPARLGPRAAPGEAETRRFYEDHPERYSRGEGRTGLYVLWNARELAASEEVSDADVRAAYDRERDTRFTQPEQRRASHILLKIPPEATPEAVARVEAKARGILKRARAGEDFAALAKRHSEDGSAAGGGDLNFFGRGQMVKEFEDAAFALPVGGVSDLVRTPFGFHVIKVTDSRAGRTVPLDEARDALREQLQLERARAQVQKRALDVARAAAGGRLEAVARSQGLTLSETGPIRSGDALPGLAASQPVAIRMLSLKPGDVSDPIPLPSGPVVVQVTGALPPEPRPFDEVRAEVEKDLAEERARSAATEAVAAAGRSGGGLKALARRLGLPVKSAADLARGQGLPDVPPDPALQKQIRTLAPGAVGDPVVTPSGIVVLAVRERRDERDQLETQRDAIRDGLVRQRQDRLYRALVRRLREHARVEINEPLVTSLDRG
jgi:peptidyl-prolyl cis-trans isomerase D